MQSQGDNQLNGLENGICNGAAHAYSDMKPDNQEADILYDRCCRCIDFYTGSISWCSTKRYITCQWEGLNLCAVWIGLEKAYAGVMQGSDLNASHAVIVLSEIQVDLAVQPHG